MNKLEEIKSRKNFYRNLFRRCVFLNMVLGVLGVVQAVLIFFLYISRPEPDYYSTSGVTAPIKLTGLSQPNNGPEPLLKPDLPDEMSEGKTIPQ